MKLHRFIGNFNLSNPEVEITNPENIKQIKDILRIKKGEKIILSDGKGTSAEVNLISLSSEKITGKIEKIEKSEKPKRRVSLYLAILKKENFEWAVQKTVEAGVCRIIPVITERTIKTGLNFSRLEKIIVEASEQSGRGTIPVLSPILNFKDALIDGKKTPTPEGVEVPTENVGIIFHPTETAHIPSANKDAKNISIFIGPEGGFTEKEIEEAKKSGYIVASLGSLILRGETAAIIATYRTAKGI